MTFNLAAMIREAAWAHPDKACLIDDNRLVTYGELEASSDAIAEGLRHHGLNPGDRVALQLPNGTEFVESYLAIIRAGMVLVPLNPLLKAAEIGYILDNCQARALITDVDSAKEAIAATGKDVFVVVAGARTDDADMSDVFPYESLARPRRDTDIASTAADDTAALVYTSGTTGKPKGAELTHFQLYMNCTLVAELAGISSSDVSLGVLPFFHVFGLATVLNTTIRRAATLVLVRRFEPRTVLDRMREHGVTLFFGVPTMFVSLLEPLRTESPPISLRVAFSGGAALPLEVVREFEQLVPGAVVLEGYGLTETSSGATFNYSASERKSQSVGRPLWGVEVRVVDEQDVPLPPGPSHVGEVTVRGHNVMKGYFDDVHATAVTLRDGWLHTGDLGYVDEDGYLFIVDRKKDLIIRGGYNVYPREVEEVLYAHPGVAEAAVIGVPDDRLGEEICAVISLTPGHHATPDDLIAHCRETLANYKCPRQVRIVDELPKGPSGKILKTVLRAAPSVGSAALAT